MIKFLASYLFLILFSSLYGNLDEKIGQMLIVGFRGREIDCDHPLAKQIENQCIGGVILYDYDQMSKGFQRNISSFEQIQLLTSQLKSFSKTPLLIAIDQEGGMVNRLNSEKGFPETTSAESLGKQPILVTLKEAHQTARCLAEMGVNVNLAPVVDLNLNPNGPICRKQRSYSSDPLKVIDYAKAVIQAHRHHNVLTTLKHFPGHGSSEADSHLGFVDISKSWSRQELIPYHKLIDENYVDLIMSAHVYNASLDRDYPATLSKKIITNLLRNELGYEGVVITDDLQMKAIRDLYSLKETIKLAILSGADLLLFANNEIYDETIAPQVIFHIKELIETGEIPLERIEESFQRIQLLKNQFNEKQKK